MAAHPDYSQTSATKPRRRRRKETTISATATATAASPDSSTKTKEPPSIDTAWCCAPPHHQHQHHHRRLPSNTNSCSAYPSPEAEPPKPTPESTMENSPRHPGAVVGPSPGRMSPAAAADGYSKFNSALTAGLLNPMSPPPPPPSSAIRSSPTLFEMMSNEQPEIHPQIRRRHAEISGNATAQERHLLLQERVNEILASGGGSPNSGQFNDIATSDVKLTLSAKDGFSVCINVHRAVLAAQSKFFGAKLSERWSLQQKTAPPFLVEISDCDDVEIYLETIRLMYCGDLKRRLMKEDVSRVLEILKVSAAIVFESGILACLEYLEAAPWAEDEEEKVASLLSQLQLDSTTAAGDVLKRVSLETPASPEEDIVVRLLDVVLHGTDEKARREMKKLVSKMLRENSSHSSTANSCLDISKGSLYSACGACLDMLIHNFSKAAQVGFTDKSNHDERVVIVGEIARQADNLNWVLDILIDRQLADDFTWIWASQVKLAEMHSRVPTMYRYEVSRLTARLCIGIGKGQILAPKEVRSLLLQTWLEPLYEDFGWMRRGCKSIDRNVMEEGLSQTILTLQLSQQQTILMNWFDRFLKCGDECPNLQRAFEVWWRRAFWRRNVETDRRRQQMQSVGVAAAYENGG